MEKLGHVYMTAERGLRTRRHETARGALNTGDVFPILGRVGAGVHKNPVTFVKSQWQFGEELALGGVKPGPCPFDRLRGYVIHTAGATGDGGVMIAEQCHCAGLDFAHHRVHRETGVGAVADIVAEKDKAADAATTSVVKAG